MNQKNDNKMSEQELLKKYNLAYSIKDSLKGLLWIGLFYLAIIFIAKYSDELKVVLAWVLTIIAVIVGIAFLIFCLRFIIRIAGKLHYTLTLMIKALEKYTA